MRPGRGVSRREPIRRIIGGARGLRGRVVRRARSGRSSASGVSIERDVARDALLEEQLDDRTIDEAWNRRGIGSPSIALARATRLIPWWCAMYDWTTTDFLPARDALGRVVDRLVDSRSGPGPPRPRAGGSSPAPRAGSIIAARAVA